MNCYSTLMFDEMGLEAGLHYGKHKDCVFGLKDFGNDGLKPDFANHALIFIIWGIQKK